MEQQIGAGHRHDLAGDEQKITMIQKEEGDEPEVEYEVVTSLRRHRQGEPFTEQMGTFTSSRCASRRHLTNLIPADEEKF